MSTVTFGTASAPYTAIRVLHQLADDENHNFPLAAPVVKYEVYVDDVFTGHDTIEGSIELRNQLIGMLKSAGFNLRKWASNCAELLNSIPIEDQIGNPSLQLTDDDSVKTLGMYWTPSSDCFHYVITFQLEGAWVTKRMVLSTIARLYDPLGLIGPIIVIAKMFSRKLWSQQLAWDEPIPTDLYTEWIAFLTELNDIDKIRIPRWLKFSSISSQRYEIHAFCDGSKNAYAAVVYLRIQTNENEFHTNLIVAKNKVTPTKPALVIPRIELCAAVLNVKLVQWVLTNIKIDNKNIKVYYWSDATIVLSWIRGDINRWPIFVANRIQKIRSLSQIDQWHHIKTDENPADCLSRGMNPSQLASHSLYWHGPTWLKENESHWPRSEWTFLDSIETNDNQHIHSIIISSSFIENHSSFTTICRISACVSRFVHNCLAGISYKQYSHKTGALTAGEINNGLLFLIRIVQHECFATEISSLKSKQPISTKSKLISLSPFIDDDNILRVYGRLQRSDTIQ